MNLKKGDIIDIIAPASFSNESEVIEAQRVLSSWGFVVRTQIDFEAYHPFHSDEDDVRFNDLKRALYATDSKVIWCIRGGYGSARLIERLTRLKKPKVEKMLIGYSDITSLHIFLNQKWGWTSLHGPMISSFVKNGFDKSAFREIKKIFFDKKYDQKFKLKAMNDEAMKIKRIEGTLAGGNLSVVQLSLGTGLEFNSKGKILILEDVGERGYKIDKMLNHLKNTKALKGCVGIVFGDFVGGLESSGESFVDFALMRFALEVKIPVFRNLEFGHGNKNRPVLFNGSKKARIEKNQLLIRHSSH